VLKRPGRGPVAAITTEDNMKKALAALLLGGAMLVSTLAPAEDKLAGTTDMQALRDAVKADKRSLVASTLALTDAEAKKFWPLYDAYQRALAATNRERAVVLEDLLGLDKPVSDRYAKSLAAELLAADEAEIKARRKLQNAVMRVLPPKKAARYLQLEAKIRAYQAYDIAVAFPLLR
jgi:Spy/CpxP family protein refolding chaperone